MVAGRAVRPEGAKTPPMRFDLVALIRPARGPMINDLWYKNAVIYCLSVGTYMDSNGDGIGDFKGLMRRLDYLHGLGVPAIWLMPFQVSPHRDDGYDVSDHYGVDPRYGTIVDLSNSPTARSNAAYVCSSTS
jgi:pullulanase/glycogen debranching enzyme